MGGQNGVAVLNIVGDESLVAESHRGIDRIEEAKETNIYAFSEWALESQRIPCGLTTTAPCAKRLRDICPCPEVNARGAARIQPGGQRQQSQSNGKQAGHVRIAAGTTA
jgi:hypothetical protein